MINLIVRRSIFNFNSTIKRFLATQSTVHNVKPNESNAAIDKPTVTAVTNYINESTQDPRHSRLFAIVWIAGSQYKVTTEDVILVRNAFYPTIGDKIRLEKVLLVGGKDFTVVGKPLLSKRFVRVDATVIEKTISNDIIRFTYTPRKDNRHWSYIKVPHTLLRINNIDVIGPVPQTNC